MKFYNRQAELDLLQNTRELAFADHSQMTVLTGRRRIGKTKLVLKSCEASPTVYLFVSRGNEAMLCKSFAQTINRTLTSVYVPDAITSFADVFEILMRAGRTERFNLVIDEFQEFFYINPSVYSLMQDIWDRNKENTHINFIISGSVQTLMRRIFQDAREPLYGRADSLIKLRPFATEVLKEILADHAANYTPDDLLALYTFTGGVPKYVDLLMQRRCTDMKRMVDYIVQPDSPFLNEGRALLIQEFGRKYGNYFDLLADIANGQNTLAELSERMGTTNIAGHLRKLEEEYELIVKRRPLLAKEGSQTVRYEIADPFLRFWFRYFIKHHALIEMEDYKQLGNIIKSDYPTYSGTTLELYFRQKLMESKQFRQIGSWWQAKKGKEATEIDIVALSKEEGQALVAEVKRQRKNFKPDDFAQKVEHLRTKALANYTIRTECFTLEVM